MWPGRLDAHHNNALQLSVLTLQGQQSSRKPQLHAHHDGRALHRRRQSPRSHRPTWLAKGPPEDVLSWLCQLPNHMMLIKSPESRLCKLRQQEDGNLALALLLCMLSPFLSFWSIAPCTVFFPPHHGIYRSNRCRRPSPDSTIRSSRQLVLLMSIG